MGTGNPMDDRARQALCDIVDREGVGVLANLPRVEAMLGDLCPGAAGEIHSLLAAGKAGAARSLERATNEQLPGVVAALSAKLAGSYGMTRSVADWAAMSWLIAARPRAAATMLAAALAAASLHNESPANGPSLAAGVQQPTPRQRLPLQQEPAPAGQLRPLANAPRSEYFGRWTLMEGRQSEYGLLVVEPWEGEGLKVSLYAQASDAATTKCIHCYPQSGSSKYVDTSTWPLFKSVVSLTAQSRLCLTRGPLSADYDRA